MTRTSGPTRRATGDDGSAVVEFALVSVLLVMLLLGVMQVGIYLHIRNVVAASAAEGARYGANADVDLGQGGPRASDVIARSLGPSTAARVPCSAAAQPGVSGSTLVAVRCRGALPVFFAPLGRLLPVDVTARALKEGA
ncbi:MAG: TadE/TadG family type IV pilus assembly protein [Mycobacteriales bacterium]